MKNLKELKTNHFMLGVCYYPEQWDESLWEDDFRKMKELGFSVIRMGEFAWTVFEPEEGLFQFDLFDRVLNLAQKYDLKVIMGTPTATPPAWLTYRYPEVLNASKSGVTYQHGHRRHYNYSSPVYLDFCARITRKIVEHYATHPAIIGWQIDNELNCEISVFYSDSDHKAFRAWLIRKYHNLQTLNKAWGTIFWNQTYTSWEQVFLTRSTINQLSNPHQSLDELRFISDNTISFAKIQADIIRDLAPHHFITTNGIFAHLDYHRMTDELLDFISFDSYPLFSTVFPDSGQEPLLDRKWSLNLSVARSVSPVFCVMEQQSGPGGWVSQIELPSPKPGQMRLWTYQSILHGADMLLYFRWRTATFGTEIYWHGIHDYHNKPNRRLAETEKIGSELSRIGADFVGAKFLAKIAILKDYDNEFDGEIDHWHGPLEKMSVSSWFKVLQYNHIPVDVKYINVNTELSELFAYDVLIYPHPSIMPDEIGRQLEQYVQQGGKLILGCRTGYKDQNGQCVMRPFPGPVSQLCGITIEDFTLIKGIVKPAKIRFKHGIECSAEMFNDIIRVEDPSVRILATYESDYYAGKPALTSKKSGKGMVYYYGAVFSDEVAENLVKELNVISPIHKILKVPKQVEVGIREKDGIAYVFLLNYGSETITIEFFQECEDLLSNWKKGKVDFEPYGVMVLKIESNLLNNKER